MKKLLLILFFLIPLNLSAETLEIFCDVGNESHNFFKTKTIRFEKDANTGSITHGYGNYQNKKTARFPIVIIKTPDEMIFKEGKRRTVINRKNLTTKGGYGVVTCELMKIIDSENLI